MNTTLRTQRLVLEEVTWDDLDKVHDLHSFPEVDEFNTLGIPKDKEQTRQVIAPAIKDQDSIARSKYCWAIRQNNDFIGLAGLSNSLDRFKLGEVYYKFSPSFWGKGYASETLEALLKFGFEKLGLHKIEAGVQTENIRSIRVLEKAGMVREGLRRKILPIRGEWKDNFHYAMLDEEWTQRNK